MADKQLKFAPVGKVRRQTSHQGFECAGLSHCMVLLTGKTCTVPARHAEKHLARSQ
jgi:hypothetical protein